MKKIALFADGTGNSAATSHKTNVWRAYHALDRSAGSNQVAFYDNGVGTSSFTPLTILGLAFGWGLARNVRQIYSFLCRTYNPGDEIYAFGFSRGAFTIRVVVALIAHQGIIPQAKAMDARDLHRLVVAAYRTYRMQCFAPSLLSFVLRPIRDWTLAAYNALRGINPYTPSKNIAATITFVGVWDTVDAYGLPIDEFTRAWDMVVWPLTAKDRDLSRKVKRARHALSLDEQRESFEPMLWNENKAPVAGHIDDQRLVQVWFAGAHSNVGGGYPDDSLALAPLRWMLDESAKNNGLAYLRSEYAHFCNENPAYSPAHDSRRGYGLFYRYAPRNVEELNDDRKPGLANWLKAGVNRLIRGWQFATVHTNSVAIAQPIIHYTVFDRIRNGGQAYAPGNIPANYAVLHPTGKILTGSKRPVENAAQATARTIAQFYIANKALGRKWLYYLTLAATITLVLYPYVARDSSAYRLAEWLEPWFGTVSVAVRAVPEVLGQVPGLGILSGVAQEYSEHPFMLVILLGAIGVLLGLGGWTTRAMHAELQENWGQVVSGAVPNSRAAGFGWFRKALGRCRQRCGYRVARSLRLAVEAIAVTLLMCAVTVASSRLYFTFADGMGMVCDEGSSVGAFGAEFSVDPKGLCFDTGLELVEGKQYEIEWKISDDWRDKTIPANARGWTGAPAYMYGATPLRRHWFVGWYEPVARIGDKLFDRYPLAAHETDAVPRGDGQRRIVARIAARTSGRLYLYVNDAVLFTWGWFYQNNRGTAMVTVVQSG